MLSFRPILQTLEPDETGLVLALAQRLSDRDRHWIANDNYGDDDGEARLAIDEVLRTGRVAGALNGDARCAMEFGRWSDPEGQEAAGSAALADAHARRLFTSAVIMQLLGKGDGDGGEVESLAGLVESAISLELQPLALNLLGWVLGGLQSRLEKHQAAASEQAVEDESRQWTGYLDEETTFLLVSILLLDRSLARPSLPAGAVRRTVEIFDELDGALLRCDGASEHQVLFRDSDRNLRDAKWRALLTQACKRENQRTAASRQDLDDDTVDRFTWLLEKALETPSTPPRVD